MLKVTTSWDDGDVLDLKLAKLLDQYEIKGTFYITKEYRPVRLSDTEIRDLSLRHEIGAHTLTHPDLRSLSLEDKKTEILGSKKWLEELLGNEVPMFCYPKGLKDNECVEVTKDAGFKGARTTALGEFSISDPFIMPTTLQVYPMPFRKIDSTHYYWRKLLEPYVERRGALRSLGIPSSSFRSFEAVAIAAFEQALKSAGVFHLWGHSWEIERYGMWEELERVLKYIGKRKECEYVINGQLV